MSLKPKQALFVASLVATGCPAVASRSDLKAAAEHGGWSCIPAWLRNDPARKVGRGQWNVADLLSGDAPVVSAPKAKSAPKPAPAPSLQPSNQGLDGLLKFLSQSSQGERNNRLYWASCRAVELVRSRQVSEGGAVDQLLAHALAMGLPHKEALATIRSAFVRPEN